MSCLALFDVDLILVTRPWLWNPCSCGMRECHLQQAQATDERRLSDPPFSCFRHPVIRRLTQKAYDWRLRAVPYHYTAFYDAHTNGCSVMRPVFFSWPSDTASFLIDRQWMLGDALMVAPILLEGTNTVPAYFPAGKWYDLYNHSSVDTSVAPLKIPVTVSAPFLVTHP